MVIHYGTNEVLLFGKYKTLINVKTTAITTTLIQISTFLIPLILTKGFLFMDGVVVLNI